MRITTGKRGLRWVLICGCVLAAGTLVAQTAPEKSAAAKTKATNEAKLVEPVPAQAAGGMEAATKPHDDAFVIGNDDVLSINVWKEPDISRSIPVRSDGRISLPLAGELQAAGRTPLQLEQDIADKLRNYIPSPEVAVMVQEIHSQKFNILG